MMCFMTVVFFKLVLIVNRYSSGFLKCLLNEQSGAFLKVFFLEHWYVVPLHFSLYSMEMSQSWGIPAMVLTLK